MITVWGACDRNGDSYIFQHEPKRNFEFEDLWESAEIGGSFKITEGRKGKNIFPKDKPQQFELKEINE